MTTGGWHVLDIKEIAIYLRKSRDETNGEEDVLANHESLLVEYANNRSLKYVIYKEIGSSEYIDGRPEMLRLLKDVEQDLYDAVLVVDIDRLGRGELEESGRIKRIFRESNTMILTPTRVYDFNNDEEQIITDIEMVFANYEYKMIKKRMIRGKKQGAKAGKWVNGKPPYPYEYNKVTKDIEVNSDKLKVYNLMKKWFLEDKMPPYEIAWELNKLGIKTNRNADWHETSVMRLLKNEVHLGKVVYGKTEGSAHKNRPNQKGIKFKDPSEWIVAEGTHEPLKTEEEHQSIFAIFEARRTGPKGTRTNNQVLSKLVYCGKCKRIRSFTNKTVTNTHIKTCSKADRFGNRCKNRGVNVEVIYAQLFYDLEQYEQRLLNSEHKENQTDCSTFQLALKNKHEDLKRLESGVDRLLDLYVEGSIDKKQLNAKKDRLQTQIQSKKDEIRTVEQSIAVIEKKRTDDDRLHAIKQFKESWNTEGISKNELNKLAKEIIDRIELNREGDNVAITIKFL